MGFRLVPNSVTLNDLERRNSLTAPQFHRIRTDYVKVVEGTLILSAAEMQAKECSFQRYIIFAIFAEITENECVTEIEAKYGA